MHVRLQPISSIKDFQFVAKSGNNPFHDPSTEQHQSGTYELYVTASGKEGTYRLLMLTTVYHGLPPPAAEHTASFYIPFGCLKDMEQFQRRIVIASIERGSCDV